MSRELTKSEMAIAAELCWQIREHDPSGTTDITGCPTCRADIVRLVDAPPSERVPEKIAGMAVVLDPTVPLGVAQIRDANGKLCAELDLLYGGYTLYRRPDA